MSERGGAQPSNLPRSGCAASRAGASCLQAILKRLKFAAQSERFSAEQKGLLDETLDSDLAAVAAEIEALPPSRTTGERPQPRREKLPPHLPHRDVCHEPANTTCGCGQARQRIGEDVAEKLGYQRGVFTVERHIRGKWVASAASGSCRRRSPRTSSSRACRRHKPPGSGNYCRITGWNPQYAVSRYGWEETRPSQRHSPRQRQSR